MPEMAVHHHAQAPVTLPPTEIGADDIFGVLTIMHGGDGIVPHHSARSRSDEIEPPIVGRHLHLIAAECRLLARRRIENHRVAKAGLELEQRRAAGAAAILTDEPGAPTPERGYAGGCLLDPAQRAREFIRLP